MANRFVRWGGLRVRIVEPDAAGNVALNVVLSHGYGAPGDDLVPLSPMIVKFERSLSDRVRFIFPEAPLDLGELGMPDGRAWWHLDLARLQAAVAMGRYRELTQRRPDGLTEAREKIQQLLQESEQETGIPISRTVLGGFSQGAMLSTDVSLYLPTLPAGLIILSGSLINHEEWQERLKSHSGLSVLQSHGQYDPLLPFEFAVQLRNELETAGNEVGFYEFPGGHEIPFDVMKVVAEFLAERIAV
jgi:phospholipase/carboxylesterase